MLGVRTVDLGQPRSCCSLQNNPQWPWSGSEQPGEELLQHCLNFPIWTKNNKPVLYLPQPSLPQWGQSLPSPGSAAAGVSPILGGRGGTLSPCPHGPHAHPQVKPCAFADPAAVPAWLWNTHCTQSSLGTQAVPVGCHHLPGDIPHPHTGVQR